MIECAASTDSEPASTAEATAGNLGGSASPNRSRDSVARATSMSFVALMRGRTGSRRDEPLRAREPQPASEPLTANLGGRPLMYGCGALDLEPLDLAFDLGQRLDDAHEPVVAQGPDFVAPHFVAPHFVAPHFVAPDLALADFAALDPARPDLGAPRPGHRARPHRGELRAVGEQFAERFGSKIHTTILSSTTDIIGVMFPLWITPKSPG